MRSLPLLLAASLLLVAGAARAPLGTSMNAPAWTAGDFWEYRFNTTFENSVYLNGTVRAAVGETRTEVVRGVSVEVFVVNTSGRGIMAGAFEIFNASVPVSGAWNLTGEEWITTASRKIVKSLVVIDADGKVPVPVPDTDFHLSWTNLTTNVIVQDAFTYPVPLGFSGTVRANSSWREDVVVQLGGNPPGTFVNVNQTEVAFTVSVPATGNTSVPAGTFETFEVRESWPDGSSDRLDYAPRAGNNARTEAFNSSGGSVSRTELVAYRYRAAEPMGDPVVLAVGIGVVVAVAIGFAVLALRWQRRRSEREKEFTPPSLRDPPTSGP